MAAYSQAIAGAPGDAALFANRSAAYLALGLHEQAAWDGAKAAALRPGWAKAHYRLGCAHLALSAWDAAAAALGRAAEMEPGSSDVEAKLAVARGRARAESAARRAQADTERRGVVTRLRAARRADQRLAMLNQFKQSMVGPDWELEDLEWCAWCRGWGGWVGGEDAAGRGDSCSGWVMGARSKAWQRCPPLDPRCHPNLPPAPRQAAHLPARNAPEARQPRG